MSSTEENKKLVETLCVTVFQNHDFSRLDEIMKDDYVHHNENDDPFPDGKNQFKEFHRQIFKAMTGFRYNINRIIAEDDIVMLYATVTGIHQGEWMGNPATNNKLNYNVVDIFRIEDGKISDHWDVADTLALFTQVGKIHQ
jgi:steroid delta-isomerase-like uncharacterized protein